MLKDLGWAKEVKLKDSSGNIINPATIEKLDELKTVLENIDNNTDTLEVTAENINLNTDTLEAKVQSVRDQLDVLLSTRASEVTSQAILDALGEESGTSILNELQTLVATLDVDLSTIATEATLQQIEGHLDTVETKLQSIIDTLSNIETNTDNLDVSLSTRATEATLEEVKNAIGEESGTNVITRLKDIWDKLVELFNTGVAKIKIWDGTEVANVTTDNRLQVEATLASGSGIEHVIQIEDGLGSGRRVKVDESNRFYVATPPPTAPPDTTEVKTTEYGIVTSSDDNVYVIPNGETLFIQRFSAGGEEETKGNSIELWYDPNGDGSAMTIIDVIFSNGQSDEHDLNSEFVGDGTRAIRMRRQRLGGGSASIFGRWEGYY